MEYEQIIYEHGESPVATLTLNRPLKMNAYTTRMCEELCHAIDLFARDDELRALVITGAGKAFCAGGDIPGDFEMAKAASRSLGHAQVMREGFHPVAISLYQLDKPVIAMLNGFTIAGGLTLALLCDFRIASTEAVIGDTSNAAGLLPDEGGAWLFPRFMGMDNALRMVMLNEKYTAEQALALGLVTELQKPSLLHARTREFAENLASRAPISLRLSKRMMRHALEVPFRASLDEAELAVMISNESQDAREGMNAFVERRDPRFIGR
jgi:2-(1,2-epoxy-1,2-dihydrophenyl)acetyl-CoA isomerase